MCCRVLWFYMPLTHYQYSSTWVSQQWIACGRQCNNTAASPVIYKRQCGLVQWTERWLLLHRLKSCLYQSFNTFPYSYALWCLCSRLKPVCVWMCITCMCARLQKQWLHNFLQQLSVLHMVQAYKQYMQLTKLPADSDDICENICWEIHRHVKQL